MVYKTKRTTFTKLVYRTVRGSRSIVALLLVSFFVIIINVALSYRIKELSNDLFGLLNTLQGSRAERLDLFGRLVACLFFHYGLHSALEYLKGVVEYSAFQIAARESARETINLEYNEYHLRGMGKNQDNVTRSSWAFSTAIITFLIDIPNCVVYFIFYSYKLAGFFYFGAAVLFFAGLSLCVLGAFLVNVFVERNELLCIKLYRNTVSYLSDMLGNHDLIWAFNNKDKEIEQYGRSLGVFSRKTHEFFSMKYTLTFIQKFALMVPHFVVITLFIYGVDLKLSAGTVLLYNMAFLPYKSNFITLRDHCFTVTKKIADMETRFAVAENDERGCTALAGFERSIVVDDVQLYAGDSLVNKNLSFTINKGDKVAITGFNGAGKSTFLKTLLRFQRHRGSITIDGIPIDEIQDDSITSLISYVPQDHHIFNNTVMYNLTYGQRTPDEQEVFRICRDFGLHEFFKGLSNGYYTHAGENGKNLSGGQKQRVNFMRAMIRGAPIVVLDEPTASLDKSSEAEMVDNIFRHCRDKTVFLIVHNLDLLRRFEKILYFRRDGVDVYGSYDQFIKNK